MVTVNETDWQEESKDRKQLKLNIAVTLCPLPERSDFALTVQTREDAEVEDRNPGEVMTG